MLKGNACALSDELAVHDFKEIWTCKRRLRI